MRILSLLMLLALAGCTYDYGALRQGTGLDAAPPPPDTGPRCATDDECDDGTWCNGPERCLPNHAEANDFGCAPGIPRCAVTGQCHEADRRCGSGCVDEDGDGYEATFCGGDDCDDSDARRNPGGSERCDAEGLDEDCNPATFGELDADGDGFPDAACCNGDFCGSDCDDNRSDINPSMEEVCDGVDNDCDGRVDEGVTTIYYRDADGDGYGVPAPTRAACSRPTGYADNANDCDDTTATRRPGAPERCNMLDDDCDGRIDEDCD